MRRSSPVQQWLDSLPTDASNVTDTGDLTEAGNVTDYKQPIEQPVGLQVTEIKSEESKSELTLTANTVIETADKTIVEPEDTFHDEKNLDVPAPKDMWKRKSLDSAVLAGMPQSGLKKRLQRDHSVQSEGYVPKFKNPLLRDHSLQSDASGSSGSSVLDVLGARKVDAESVLVALGFGPSEKQQKLQRIPDRFLVPSKLRGISTEQFIKDEQHSMRMHDCGVFGYRGLTGNPHVPPSTIVAKIMDCILQDDACREEALMKARHSIADMRTPAIHARLAAASRLRLN